MSSLENYAKPFLQPLLVGTPTLLDYVGQSSVSAWAVKTAMVIEGVEFASQGRYSREERKTFGALAVVPQRTTIWLASLPDETHFYSAKRLHLDRVTGTRFTAMVITIGLAKLALQVLTMRVPPEVDDRTQVTTGIKRGQWDESTVRIWPAHTLAVRWPPRRDLNGEMGLDELANRFGVAGMQRTDLQDVPV